MAKILIVVDMQNDFIGDAVLWGKLLERSFPHTPFKNFKTKLLLV